PGKALGAVDFCYVLEVGNLFAAVLCKAGCNKCADYPAIFESPLENLEVREPSHEGPVLQLQTEAKVGLVGTVGVHGDVVGNSRERCCELHAERLPENVGHETLNCREDVLLVHEAHFNIYLSVFRLPVATGVLVAEAVGKLEIFVEAGDHQNLLEKLRTLRQSVKIAGVNSRRNKEVARTLGGRADHCRSFNFKKTAFGQKFAGAEHYLAAQGNF